MLLFPIFLATCVVAGASGFFSARDWYRAARQAGLDAAGLGLPVVWTILYVLIAWPRRAIAAYPGTGMALAFWSLQITLNTLWSGVFFGLRRMLAGVAIIVLLWLAVLATTLAFWMHDGPAALMMVPYTHGAATPWP